MTSIIKNQLLKRLSRYVKNLSREQLHISSLRGALSFSHLEFDEDAMTDLLELPDWLRLHRMTCNKVQISIPWTSLNGKSIKVVLDEVRVDLVTCDELRPTKPPASDADTASTASSASSDKGFGSVTGGHYGFIEKVIDGVQLIINLVDVNFYTPRFHVSAHIDRLDVYPCTPKWQPASDDYRRARVKSEDRGQTLIFKRLDFQTMRLTAQERAPADAGSQNESHVASAFRILASASVLLKMKRRLSDSSILFATLTSLLDETLIVLTDSQLIGACGFVEDLHRLIVKSNEATKLDRARQKLDDVQKNRESVKTSTSSSSPARKTNQAAPAPAGMSQAALQRLPSGKQVLSKEELFTVFDIQETSYHVNVRSLELQVCDETPEEGSMRIMLQALHLDLYPFHCESWSSADFNVDSLGDFDIVSSQKHHQRYEDTVIVGSPFGRSGGAVTRSGGSASGGAVYKTYLPHTKERLAWKKKLLLTKRIQFNRSMLLTHNQRFVGTAATAGNNPKPLQPSMDSPLLLSSNVLVTLGDIMASAVTKNKSARARNPNESPQYDAPLLMSLRETLKLPSNLPVMFVEHVEFFFPSLQTTLAADAAATAASGGGTVAGNASSRRDSSASIASSAYGQASHATAPLISRSTSHTDPTWASPQGPGHHRVPLLNTLTSVNESAASSLHAQQQPGFASSADGKHEESGISAALAAMVPNSLLYINVNPMQVTLHIETIEWFAGRLRYILPELSDLLGILAPIPASGSEFIGKVAKSVAAKLTPDTDMFVDCMMLKAVLPTELPYQLLEEMPFHGTFGSASLNAREKAKPAALVATVSNLTIRNNVQAFDRLPSEEPLDDEGVDAHGRKTEAPPLLTVDKVFEKILRQVNSTTNPNLAPGSKPMQTADQLKFNFVVREMQRRYEYACTHRGPSSYRSAHNQQNMMLISIEQLWVETEGPAFFAMPMIRPIPLRVAVVSLNAASLARQLISHASDVGASQRIDPYFLSLLSETVESVALVWVSLPKKRAVAQLQRVVLHGFIRAIDRLTMCIDDIQMAIADVVHEQHVLRYAPLPPSALRHGNYLLLMTDGIDEACADLVLTIKPPTSEAGSAAVVAGVAGMQIQDKSFADLSRQETITSQPDETVNKRSVHFEAPRHGDAFADASRGRPTFSPPSSKNSNDAALDNVGGSVVFEGTGSDAGKSRVVFKDPLGGLAADNASVGRGSFDDNDTDSIRSSSGISSGTVTSVPSLSKLDEMYANVDDDASSLADNSSTSDFVCIDDEELNEFDEEHHTGPKVAAALRRAFTRFDTAVEEQHELDDDDDVTHAISKQQQKQRLDFSASAEKSGSAANKFVEDLRDKLTFAVQNIDVIVESWPRMQIEGAEQQQQPSALFDVGSSRVASPTRAQVPRSVSILVVRVAVKRVKVADTQRLQWQEVQRMYSRRDEEYAEILHSSFPLAAAITHRGVAGLNDVDELKQVSVLFVKDPMEDGVAGKKGRVEVAAGGLGVDLQHHIAQALGDFGADTDFMAHLPTIASTSGGGQLPIKLYIRDVRVVLGDMPLVPRYQPVTPAVASAAVDERQKLASATLATARNTHGGRAGNKEADEMFDSPSSSMLKHTVGAVTDERASTPQQPLSAAALLAKSTPLTHGSANMGAALDKSNANATTADLRGQLEHFEMMRNNAQYMIENLQNLLKGRPSESSVVKK